MVFQGIGIGLWDAFLPILEFHVSWVKSTLVLSEMNSECFATGNWVLQISYALSQQENPQDYSIEHSMWGNSE